MITELVPCTDLGVGKNICINAMYPADPRYFGGLTLRTPGLVSDRFARMFPIASTLCECVRPGFPTADK